MKPFVLAAVLIVASLSASAGHAAGDKPAAEKVVAAYYKAFNGNDIDRAAALYSDDFYRETARPAWKKTLRKIRSVLGKAKSYELQRSETSVIGEKKQAGTNVLLVYKVRYENDDATETFNIFRPANNTVRRILNQTLEPARLVVEMEK